MITQADLNEIVDDSELFISVIGYKCTNCHTIYEDADEAEECCPD